MKRLGIIWSVIFILLGCSRDTMIEEESPSIGLTIFFVNDQHGEINNFAKVKHIVDKEELETNVIVACSGDIFSGNPVVDNHPEKGYPIIDIMNQVGFDISVLGNHEFDYGESILEDRIQQAKFEWVCANVDMSSSVISQPPQFKTLQAGDLKITFLGLVETNGKGRTIPLTHPWKIKNIDFSRPETVVDQFANLKEQEQTDLYIALTHLGHTAGGGAMGDFQLAEQFPYFDLIIGGHTNQLLGTEVNDIPVFQAGNNLNYLGKISLMVSNRQIQSYEYELIDLNAYTEVDASLKKMIDEYNASMPELDEVIGFSHMHHERWQVGCFYTDAMRGQMEVDVSFQNSGGVRAGLDGGEIMRKEIYEIDPFHNGTIQYNMSVREIKDFLMGSGSGFYYSGIEIEQLDDGLQISNEAGVVLSDTVTLSIGINDFTPAVFDNYFPESGVTQTLTSAETIINYLETKESDVDYPDCTRFFRYK